MNILIRADSSSEIGLGHIMRDLVFAGQYPDDTVAFACRNLEGNMIDRIPYPVHILASDEPEEVSKLITGLNIDMVVFDHYGIDAAYEEKIKNQTGVTILSFDDTYAKHYCDILLNHNISANPSRYQRLVPEHCELRCGSAYTLIRDEFKVEKAIDREKVYDVFISMGGTDPTNITLTILKTLSDDLSVCVVTTTGNPHLDELESFIRGKENIALYVNSEGVAKLLHQSRLAIVTPSVMVHEVLFMEIPFIAIKTVSNQTDLYAYLKGRNYPVSEEWNVDTIAQFHNA